MDHLRDHREERTRDKTLTLYHDKFGRTGEASKADWEGMLREVEE